MSEVEICFISCGLYYSICVDETGVVWSFGDNLFGNLGTGNLAGTLSPVKIEIPPVSSVCCGRNHTLCLTIQKELWSFGSNAFGELCLGASSGSQSSPTKTSFCDIQLFSA